METLKISGPCVLEGAVTVQGSKNAALPMMAASVINKGTTILKNCPDISDVRNAAEILRYIGCRVDFKDNVMTIDASGDINGYIPCEIMNRLRASFVFTGALLARCKKFSVSHPGGCNIGHRPVDIHLESFRKLGARVETTTDSISCSAEKYIPCDISLRFPSVGATENIMIYASAGNGKTRIFNCAREPEIEDLQNMLNSMGAHITGAGTSVITIEPADSFDNCQYTVMPDRIDAATYLTALACCRGNLTIENVRSTHLLTYINVMKKCGMDIEVHHDSINAGKTNRLKGGINAVTRPYPGFATDTQSLLMAALSLSDGVSLIRENIFENRFCLSSSLIEMGADIRIYNRTASVRGVRSLEPISAGACDLRSGAALCCAMMSCEGTSELYNVECLYRGYENFCEKYRSIGAYIERIENLEET